MYDNRSALPAAVYGQSAGSEGGSGSLHLLALLLLLALLPPPPARSARGPYTRRRAAREEAIPITKVAASRGVFIAEVAKDAVMGVKVLV